MIEKKKKENARPLYYVEHGSTLHGNENDDGTHVGTIAVRITPAEAVS